MLRVSVLKKHTWIGFFKQFCQSKDCFGRKPVYMHQNIQKKLRRGLTHTSPRRGEEKRAYKEGGGDKRGNGGSKIIAQSADMKE